LESRWGARFSAPVQTGPGTQATSCAISTASLYRVKVAGVWRLPTTPSSAKVKERVELFSLALPPSPSFHGLFWRKLYHSHLPS